MYLGEQAKAANAADDAVHLGEARATAGGLRRDREAPSGSPPSPGLLPTGADGVQGQRWGLGGLCGGSGVRGRKAWPGRGSVQGVGSREAKAAPKVKS